MLSDKLATAVEKIQPAGYELSFGDSEALWQLMFEQWDFLRGADIRLREHGVEADSAGQNESSRWGIIIVFPLSVGFNAIGFDGTKVTFTPQLHCAKHWGEEWIFNYLAKTLKMVEPTREAFLDERAIAIPRAGGTFYCFASDFC